MGKSPFVWAVALVSGVWSSTGITAGGVVKDRSHASVLTDLTQQRRPWIKRSWCTVTSFKSRVRVRGFLLVRKFSWQLPFWPREMKGRQ